MPTAVLDFIPADRFIDDERFLLAQFSPTERAIGEVLLNSETNEVAFAVVAETFAWGAWVRDERRRIRVTSEGGSTPSQASLEEALSIAWNAWSDRFAPSVSTN